ncbi:MAG: peptide chain release factor-like protein [Myxococcota bacterium]|nr:peptide chain release factor-like protein [Myxococcota bacterium]
MGGDKHVGEAKKRGLASEMVKLGIKESDLREKFVRGRGAGGQKINKSSSAVSLRHIPTGIEVFCDKARSQIDNRFFARRLLIDKFKAEILGLKSQKESKAEKIRKQKQRRRRRGRLDVNESQLSGPEEKE